MKTGKKILLILTQVLAVLGFVFLTADKVEARELSGAISDVNIWRPNYKVADQTNGVYQLLEDVNYTFQVGVDLTANGSNVADGDYFTFDIPAPYSVTDETFDLLDTDTGIAIGSAAVTSAGPGQGGRVVITLKNIQTYLAQKNAQEVFGIRGTFYVDFTSKATNGDVTTTFTNIKDVGSKNLIINVKQRGENGDNTGVLGRENVAKYAGVLSNRPYTSAALGKSSDWQHPWAMRINASRKSYTSLTLTDTIDQSASNSQFIPETVELRASDTGFDHNYALQNSVTLVQGVDYTVSFNSDHSQMTINITNPGNRAFYLLYGTTAPVDGSFVGNTYQLSSPEGAIPVHDGTSDTSRTVTRQSLITQGGTIELQTASRITVQKVDANNDQPLAGAIFKVTKPDGTELTLSPTDSNGVAQSPSFTAEEMAAGNFTITEVQAPAGYEIDPTPRVVTVTSAGVVEKFTNKPVNSIVNPPGSPSDSSSSSSSTGSNSSSSTSSTSGSTSSSTSTSTSSIINAPGTGSDDNNGNNNGNNNGANNGSNANNGQQGGGNTAQNTRNQATGQRRVLPRTGERVATWTAALGIVLVVLAGGLAIAKRKKG